MQCREHLLKILIVGDGQVGKSSMVLRYASGKFSPQYKMTVGVDFAMKTLAWSDTETVRLQLWDIAGQERFISMTRIYYKEASGCAVMFDVTDHTSFLNCLKWKKDLDSKAMLPSGAPIPCILLANKCDLPNWAVSPEDIETFCKAHGFVGWMETSSKENKNIAESMRFLVENIMDNGSRETRDSSERSYIQLDSSLKEANSPGCC